MSQTYLLFPKILKGKEVEEWKANRRQVVFDIFKRRKLDGINPYITATYDMKIDDWDF